jgi:hypothetical protein
LKIDVGSAGLRVTEDQRQSVERRLLLALTRFSGQLERVKVRLSNVANPMGGVDRRCQMEAWLRSGGSVAVETVDGPAAVDRAAIRLAARVEWAVVDGWSEIPSQRITVALPSHGPRNRLSRHLRRKRLGASRATRRRP